MFLNPNNFSKLNSYWPNLSDMRNLQEQVKKHYVTKDCSDLSLFEQIVLEFLQISPPSVSNFKSFSRLIEHFFLPVGKNNFGKKNTISFSVSVSFY